MFRQVTIVLPTFNRKHVFVKTLPSYRALGVPLLVVDDGSIDGMHTWVKELGIPVVRHERNRGLPAARNTGLRNAKTPWVLFGEDDVIMHPSYPTVLWDWVKKHPRTGAVAGQLFDVSEWQLGERPAGSSRPRYHPDLVAANFTVPMSRPVAVPTVHACALVNRTAALDIGGYDESLWGSAFREESDFYARLWHAGHSVWLTPETWALHVRHRLGGGCRGAITPQRKLINRWSYIENNLRWIDRHYRFWRHWQPGGGPGRMKICGAWNVVRRMIPGLT